MAHEKEGAESMARWHERQRRLRSVGMVREEERPSGPRGPKGQIGWWVAGPTRPKFEGKFFLE
jgi:hypothetical protein